jgi:hypothetical protein
MIMIWHNFQDFIYETASMKDSQCPQFHTKKSKILQILQLAICQLICNMYDWKYFVILVPTSIIHNENYNLHFAFYISLLKFISILDFFVWNLAMVIVT